MSGSQPPPPTPPLQHTAAHDHYMRPRRSVTLAHGSSTSTEARGSQYSTRTRGGVHPQSRSQSGSQSPTKQDHGSKSARGAGTNHSTSTEDDDEEDEEAEGEEDLGLDPEMSKLEKKRERNRDKQRKLRQRRAEHIASLEYQVKALKRETASSREQLSITSANEAKYRSWVTDLEAALFRQGSGDEVEGLRRVWGGSIRPLAPPTKLKGEMSSGVAGTSGSGGGSRRRKGHGRTASSANVGATLDVDHPMPTAMTMDRRRLPEDDPLKTLVQAAMVSEHSLVPAGAYQAQSHATQPPLPPTYYRYPPPSSGAQASHVRTGQSSSSSSSTSMPVSMSVPRPQSQHVGVGPALPIPQPLHRPHHFDPYTRRPSTSYTPSSTTGGELRYQHALLPEIPLKRKRSLSGPTPTPSQHPNFPQSGDSPNDLPSFASLSEPSSSTMGSYRRPFNPPQIGDPSSTSSMTLAPMLPPSSYSSPSITATSGYDVRDQFPSTADPTVPGPSRSHSAARTPTPPVQSMKIEHLLTPQGADGRTLTRSRSSTPAQNGANVQPQP